MQNHYYNKNLKAYARELRTESKSRAERLIWQVNLRRKQTGYRFLRQRPIKNYIVDFFCPELGLIIEIDGNSHLFKGDYDKRRQNELEDLGFVVVRFEEGEVLNNLNDVVRALDHVIYCLTLEDSDGLKK